MGAGRVIQGKPQRDPHEYHGRRGENRSAERQTCRHGPCRAGGAGLGCLGKLRIHRRRTLRPSRAPRVGGDKCTFAWRVSCTDLYGEEPTLCLSVFLGHRLAATRVPIRLNTISSLYRFLDGCAMQESQSRDAGKPRGEMTTTVLVILTSNFEFVSDFGLVAPAPQNRARSISIFFLTVSITVRTRLPIGPTARCWPFPSRPEPWPAALHLAARRPRY